MWMGTYNYITCKISGQTRSASEGVWVQGGGLEIRCMYDVFVEKEHTEQSKTLKEKRQASRRWNSLERYLTVHDHRMNVEYVINVMEKLEFIEN